jgi:hypothetical protein
MKFLRHISLVTIALISFLCFLTFLGNLVYSAQQPQTLPTNSSFSSTSHTLPNQNSNPTGKALDIQDIANVIDVPELRWPRWILLFLLVAIPIGLLIYVLRKKKSKKNTQKATRLPPHQEAIQALAELESQQLLNEKDRRKHKDYCFTLSSILRVYLSRCYQFDAVESTTEEFLEKVEHINLTTSQQDSLKDFCMRTDLVKFADQLLPVSEGQEVLQIVKNIVQETQEGNKNIEPKEGTTSPKEQKEPSL